MVTSIMMPITATLGLCILLTGCSTASQSTREINRRLVTRINTEIFNAHNTDLVMELYAEDAVGHFPGATVRGNDALREQFAGLFAAFPDWHEELHRVAIDGDLAFIHFTSSGTNTGDWAGQPATGNKVEFEEAAWFQIRDGRVIEQRVFPDLLGMRNQLGSLPFD